MTEWRKIPGFSRYSVSDDGCIRRDERVGNWLPGPVSMKPHVGGYPRAALTSDDGKYRGIGAHVAVALAFIGPRPRGMMVCHNDGNPANNHVSNLRYDTAAGNVRDAIRHGTQIRGSRQHLAKLDDARVAEIKRLLVETTLTLRAIAAQFGITSTTVLHIRQGRTWGHIEPTGDITSLRPAGASKSAHQIGGKQGADARWNRARDNRRAM